MPPLPSSTWILHLHFHSPDGSNHLHAVHVCPAKHSLQLFSVSLGHLCTWKCLLIFLQDTGLLLLFWHLCVCNYFHHPSFEEHKHLILMDINLPIFSFIGLSFNAVSKKYLYSKRSSYICSLL